MPATLKIKNPASGELIREVPVSDPNELTQAFRRARVAQKEWARVPIKQRAQLLIALREVLVDQADAVIDLLSRENGKPRFEALANEVIPACDTLTYFAKHAPRLLRDQNIPLALMKHRRSTLNFWPVGVVAVISPWNYPFLLPFAEILMALVAGNAVIFKPSEVTPLIGLKIQELCEKAGFPPDLIQTFVGDGSLGAAIIEHKPNKIFFTGSVATGKKIMAAAAQHLIPVNLELGGKDAMIVLPDADLDFATSAALWGAFSNSGQVCASTERILVHESIAEPFAQMLKKKARLLRPGDPQKEGTDLGAITFDKQKLVYERQIEEAKNKGVEILTGGEFSPDRTRLSPTIVRGPEIERMAIYREETFGPVVAIASYKTVDEAVQKANDSPYGLLGSVISQSLSVAEKVARRLEVGTVTINEVVYTAGLGETPWGGLKESGIGRSHAEIGLHEFVNVRHIHQPRGTLTVFKSPWWFPYSPSQYRTFRSFLELYRRSWFAKGRALPGLTLGFLKLLSREKRL